MDHFAHVAFEVGATGEAGADVDQDQFLDSDFLGKLGGVRW